MAVRKSAKGAALRRWFKEDWRTPSGDKDYSCLLYTSPSPRD